MPNYRMGGVLNTVNAPMGPLINSLTQLIYRCGTHMNGSRCGLITSTVYKHFSTFTYLYTCNCLINMLNDYQPDWDIYPCRIEENPAIIGLDLDLRRFAPLKEMPHAIYISVYLNDPREDGFPQGEEFNKLGEIEDALVHTLKSKLDAQFVGRTISNGVRDFYFYAGGTLLHDKFIADVMISFPDYRYDYGVKEDKTWELYFDYLFPDMHEFQRIQNRRVLRTLQQHGDLSEIERPIDHWIYFKQDTERERFREHIEKEKFTVTEVHTKEGAQEYPLVLQICRTDKADEETIDRVVMELWILAQECNAYYDGWETVIVKEKEQNSPH